MLVSCDLIIIRVRYFTPLVKNLPEIAVIILMNKFIRIQICINGFGRVNVFVLFCQNPFPKTKRGRGRALTLICLAKSVKSVQSALSDLLTTSATHGTFSRPSTETWTHFNN